MAVFHKGLCFPRCFCTFFLYILSRTSHLECQKVEINQKKKNKRSNSDNQGEYFLPEGSAGDKIQDCIHARTNVAASRNHSDLNFKLVKHQ